MSILYQGKYTYFLCVLYEHINMALCCGLNKCPSGLSNIHRRQILVVSRKDTLKL